MGLDSPAQDPLGPSIWCLCLTLSSYIVA